MSLWFQGIGERWLGAAARLAADAVTSRGDENHEVHPAAEVDFAFVILDRDSTRHRFAGLDPESQQEGP
jgi:hypothetical protein